jgi:glycerophosphoryl diester phosphodiesterase
MKYMIRVISIALLCIAAMPVFSQSEHDALLICGHRGGFYNLLPENSRTAIRYTVGNCALKPVVVEVDVRKSKDGTLYILHDETVDRTTNGNGNITTLTDAYINSLKLKTSSGMLTDESVPAFRDVLMYAKSNNVVLMLDVKDDIWKDVISLVNEYDIARKCIALTFNPAVTAKVHSLSNVIAISFLAKDVESWNVIQKINIPHDNLVAYVTSATDVSLINIIHQLKISIIADASESMRNKAMLYSVEFYRSMIQKMKLNILITDFPVEVSKLLQQK